MNRLNRNEAMKLVVRIHRDGTTTYVKHAEDEMWNDGLTTNDITNVLTGGRITEEPELIKGEWRYRVHTQRICVVVEFESSDEIVVVTAWRKRK